MFIYNAIPKGFIVIAACMDDCVTQLSNKSKCWFADMGSQEIWNLGYRQGFAFIGIMGEKKANEMRALESYQTVSVTQILETNVDIETHQEHSLEEQFKQMEPEDTTEEDRREYLKMRSQQEDQDRKMELYAERLAR